MAVLRAVHPLEWRYLNVAYALGAAAIFLGVLFVVQTEMGGEPEPAPASGQPSAEAPVPYAAPFPPAAPAGVPLDAPSAAPEGYVFRNSRGKFFVRTRDGWERVR